MTNHIEDLLSAYMDEECTDYERRQFEVHLSRCPECLALWNDAMDLKQQVFTAFHSIRAPKEIEEKVIQAIRIGVPSKGSRPYNWLFALLLSPLFFIAIALVWIGSYVYKVSALSLKVFMNLIYALGNILVSDSYVILYLVGFSLLLIIASSVSLKRLLKTKTI